MIRIRVCPVGMLQANCYLAWNEETKKGFLVDPGDNADRILRLVEEEGVSPEAVLLTHGHFDHIGAADRIRRVFGIPVLAGEEETPVLDDPLNNLSGVYTYRPLSLKADGLLADEEEISSAGSRIRVLYTPGHSQGGVCYYLPEEGILFSGDTLFLGSYGRTDGPGGDEEEMFRSLAKLFTELPPETRVLPGHGMDTTIEEERESNQAVLDLQERKLL